MTVFWCWKMTSVPTWACSTNYALKSAWLRLATGSTCAQMMLSSTPCKSQCALNLWICSCLQYFVDFSCTQQLVYINLFLWFLSLSWFNLVISFLWCLSTSLARNCLQDEPAPLAPRVDHLQLEGESIQVPKKGHGVPRCQKPLGRPNVANHD